MNKKLVFKYIMLYIPVIMGLSLFVFGIVNIFNSLLLFLGGYIAIKNSLDYRLIRKNIEKSKVIENTLKKEEKKENVSYSNVIGLKMVRRYSRVRRKY